MYLSATPEVRVETSGNDVSYVFPPRSLGNWRWLGLLPVGFSALLVLGPIRGVVEALLRPNDAREPIFQLVSLAFVAALAVMCSLPACLGLLLMFGRCRVDWRDGRLVVVDYLGPIRWRRRLPKQPIRKFVVKTGGAKVNDRPITSGPLAELGALVAEFEQGKPLPVVIGYPRDWLQDLARDLALRVGASASTLAAPTVEFVELGASEPKPVEVTEKPADSPVRVENRINGISLIVPPAGIKKGSKGMFGFGIVWCLILLVITATIFTDGKPKDWSIFLFIVPFLLIGLGLLAAAVHVGRRQATLSVEHGRLSVAQSGPFGAKLKEWQRGDIAAIRVDKSGMEVNHVPILELQVYPVAGKKTGFLGGRDEQELRWIATELRKALNVPAERK